MERKLSLVLLPGLMCDDAFWRAQIDALGEICVPRVMSYGRSDSIEAMAQHVLAEAPVTFALAGHSMGGRVALEICRRAPRRVAKLGLFCTDFRSPASEPARDAEALDRHQMLEVARTGGLKGFARMWIPRVIAPDRLGDAKLIAAITDMFCRQSYEMLEGQTHAGLTRPDYADDLSRIACPTLICAGERDLLRSVEVHRQMASRIKGSRLAVIPRSGHMVAMEQPRALNDAMRRWLVDCEAVQPRAIARALP